MKIYRACLPNWLAQGYDANPNMVDFYKQFGMTSHGGYDWAFNDGTPVFYDCDIPGYVDYTEVDSSGGLGVNIITEENGKLYKHRYWHFKEFGVKTGDKVKIGDFLGLGDSTGRSTGPHLHRDIKELSRDKNLNWQILNHNNGTFGAIRMDEWFENTFVLDKLSWVDQRTKLLLALLKTLIYKYKKK